MYPTSSSAMSRTRKRLKTGRVRLGGKIAKRGPNGASENEVACVSRLGVEQEDTDDERGCSHDLPQRRTVLFGSTRSTWGTVD